MGSTRTWQGGIGGGSAVAQVTTITVGGTLAGETFIISCQGVAIATFVDVSHAVNDAATGLRAAWNASTNPLATGITAAGSGADVTLTADTAGTPFAVTVNSPGASATFVKVETTANVGANYLTTAENFLTGVAPVSTDSLVFPAMAAATLYNVSGQDFSAVLLVATGIEAGCAIVFGSRTTPLHLDTDTLVFEGTGQAFLQIDNSTEIDLYGAGSPTFSWDFGLMLTGAGNTLLDIDPGSGKVIGLAPGVGQTLAATTIQISSGTVVIGSGVTATTIGVANGTVQAFVGCTTLSVKNGTFTQQAGTGATVNLYGGNLLWNSTTAPTTFNQYGGTLDFTGDQQAKNWSSVAFNGYGGTVKDLGNVCTLPANTHRRGGTWAF
jgi:hypothetical protein